MRALVPALLLLAACGPRYGRRVPEEVVARLPYEIRIDLLESENDLALALDRMDEAASEVDRAREAIRQARSRQGAAEQEERRATDDAGREVARLAVEEARWRVEYLRANQRLNVALRGVEELALRCAFARYELARLEATRKAKAEGSERLEPEQFQQQVTQCEAELEKERAALEDEKAAEKEARTAWEEKKAALAKKTFDVRASPYVEDL